MLDTKQRRTIRKLRVRNKIKGVTARARLSVSRSNKYLFAQIIDDAKHKTVIGLSDKTLVKNEKNKIKRAFTLGEMIAEKALKAKIAALVFDRSGFTYHGRVKALAEGLRKGGVKL
ncbi:MAG: 50S ribosomal protein L18 [Candidatus Gottesmanbacteria bacterium GW2011_GWA1_34_13]|uniref:Large ribosomal subunit protein uL18 n=1 Tax=Candidatus Gottesmanbacteria bacterium GW2011_GWA1_34_13 TaxID=1618434 RepID=A0A0G0ASE4_9BACT|nr:MAG: 50S ribosomal protein L18 [Candidatus Gottesmanbacteria bacterium GW2011_GWA1_34_13]